jgi:hypothetical protein
MGFDCSYIKSIDIFGRPVTLMFNDKDKFKTYCGAFATIIMITSLTFALIVSMQEIARGKIEYFFESDRILTLKDENLLLKNYTDYQKQIIVAVGLESKLFDPEIVNLTIYTSNASKKDLERTSPLYNCTNDVLSNVSELALKFMPKGLEVKCLKIPI